MRVPLTLLLLSGALAAQVINPVEQTGAIHGTILDSAGHPLLGVAVDAYRGAQPEIVRLGNGTTGQAAGRTYSGRSNASGNYTVANMSPGTYFVKSERDAESNDYKQVVVAAGADVALDFTVPANVTLSGRVLDPDGKPVAEASVYLLTLAYRNGLLGPVLSGPKQTHADGVYLFDYGLQPNRKYYVLVDRKIPEDLQGRDTIEVPTYHPSAHSFAEALPIALQNGEQRSGVDIQIARAPFFCVAGKILEGSGSFSIQESALAGSALKHAAGKVDSEGNYRVCGITSGDYRLSEQNAFTEFIVAKTDVEHADLFAAPAHLRLQADWDRSDTMPDPPVVNLHGNISASLGVDVSANGTGGPVQLRAFLARIELVGAHDGSSVQYSARVPSDFPLGRGISPGDYTLEFGFSNAGAYYPKEIIFNDEKVSDGIVRVPAGTDGTLRVVLARDTAKVNVNVVGSDGTAIPFSTVVLIPESVTGIRQLSRDAVHGTTNQAGAYQSPALVPGKYRVLATTQTVRWNAPEDLERILAILFQSKSIEAPPNGSTETTVAPTAIY